LRGCVRLLKAEETRPEWVTTIYRQLASSAVTPAEKKLILSGLAVAQDPAARGIIERLADDDAVKAEAALALEAAARNTPPTISFDEEATVLIGKVGDARLVDSPIAGKALSLDGRDAHLELRRTAYWSVGDGAFTVALWVCPRSLRVAGLLCVGGYDWRHGWLLDVHPDGSVRLETSKAGNKSNGSIRTPGGTLPLGRWTHIAVIASRGDNNARILVNGRERARGRIDAEDLTNPEANVVIGGIENRDGHTFHGEIDELIIRKKALDADEIQALIEPGRGLIVVENQVRPTVRSKPPVTAVGEYVSLFDGESFAGWEGDTDKTWRIEHGAITAGSLVEEAARNEFLATTREYENFDLRLKFRIIGDKNVNAGVQLRTSRIPNHHDVCGYQADIGPGLEGHLYDECRRRCMLASPDGETLEKAQRAVGPDGWQTYRIRAEGDRIQFWFNGVQTVDYVEEEADIPRTGIIALQIHGGMQAIVAYKDIEIQELPASR
jgi:hypothetical protein